MIFRGMAVKRLGMVGVIVREMNALTVEIETVTIGEGRWTYFVY
jgi:hypothetical protein